ncbi:hypothetical protein CMO92_01785 [Candidatus Woesearchaeota archaeon]|nr:hypothetical protein [Candidatus Woesearchaeota archaeon]|tara:strand:- start:219 stop:473 length:255 start_codon:yes stop_codon:yes gene_type:complete
MEEIKKLIGSDKLLLGKEEVMKALRASKLLKIFIAKNCDETLKADLDHYISLSDTELIHLEITNDELGTLCKKPFCVAILGLLK